MSNVSSEQSAVSERFSRMYEAHQAGILRHCQRKVRDDQMAEDITQETFLRAWVYMSNGKSIENAKTFLCRTADHLIIDRARQRESLAGVSLDEMREHGFDPGYETLGEWQQNLEISSIMECLRKKEGKLLTMRYLEGLRPCDIAHRIGLAPNTVTARLHRIVKRLTTRLRKSETPNTVSR